MILPGWSAALCLTICQLAQPAQPGALPPLGPAIGAEEPEPTPPVDATAPLDAFPADAPPAASDAAEPPADSAAPAHATDPPLGQPAPLEQPAASQPLAEVDPLQPLELGDRLYRALAAAAASGLEGRPLALTDALARVSDPTARLEAVHAYWQLAASMLDFHFRDVEARALEQLLDTVDARAANSQLSAAKSAADARRQEAQLAVVDAQSRLTRALRASAANEVYLASDAPHAGPYKTKFDQLFQTGVAPPQAWLLNRVLPLRHQEVQSRWQATQSAELAAQLSDESHRAGAETLTSLLDDLALVTSVRRSLVASLRQYNDEIANYALGVFVAPSQVQPVAGMLIKPRHGQPDEADQGVRRAQFDEPAAAPPAEAGASDLTREEIADLLANTQVFPGLVELDDNLRAQRLVSSLYQAPVAAPPAHPISLLDALKAPTVASQSRLDLIHNYWLATEYAARRRLLEDAVAQLEMLRTAAALEGAGKRPSASSALVTAAQASARGDQLATEIALANERWWLSTALGKRLNDEWVMPVTPPHAGRYRDKVAQISDDPTFAVRARLIARVYDVILAQAAAVVSADQARSAALATFAQSPANPRPALKAIGAEINETLGLCANITRFNHQIAEYALAVLPANISPEILVSTLIVSPAESSAPQG